MWTPWIQSPAHPTAWAPPAHGARRALIDVLLRVSALLVRTAVRLQRTPLIAPVIAPVPLSVAPVISPVPRSVAPVIAPLPRSVAPVDAPAPKPAAPTPGADEPASAAREFHAEAGAPEGALYVDGRLVGHLSGVPRL